MVVHVGVRDLRSSLSSWLGRVQAGDEVIVTDRGKPVARIVGYERKSRLQELIDQGIVKPATAPKSGLGRPKLPPLEGDKTLSDIIIEQRQSRPY